MKVDFTIRGPRIRTLSFNKVGSDDLYSPRSILYMFSLRRRIIEALRILEEKNDNQSNTNGHARIP